MNVFKDLNIRRIHTSMYSCSWFYHKFSRETKTLKHTVYSSWIICKWIYIQMNIYTYTYIYIHVYIYMHTHRYIHIYINTHTHTYIHIHTQIYIHTVYSRETLPGFWICRNEFVGSFRGATTRIRSGMHIYMYVYIYICVDTNTWICLCINLYVFMYICIHMWKARGTTTRIRSGIYVYIYIYVLIQIHRYVFV
jgi:hypothetical protein